MHERIFHFDIIRTVACLMVIIMHAPMPSDRIIAVFTWGITYLTMPCIGLFLHYQEPYFYLLKILLWIV